MPLTVLLNDTGNQYTLNTDDNYLLADNVTHYQASANPAVAIIRSGGNELIVNGSIVQIGGGNAIYDLTFSAPDGVHVTVGDNGRVQSGSGNAAIYLDAPFSSIVNSGSVTGGIPVQVKGFATTINNGGDISQITGEFGFLNSAVTMEGLSSILLNSGIISGWTAITASHSAEINNTGSIIGVSIGIERTNNGSFTTGYLVNAGEIIVSDGDAYIGSGGADYIINSGQINGKVFLSDGNNSLFNTGEVIGYVSSSNGNDIVENTGTMVGDISLGTIFETTPDEDTFVNAGTVVGNVTFDWGNDIYRAVGNAVVTGFVDGGSGADTLVGGKNDDSIFGGSGNDTLRGGNGEDYLSGGENKDVIYGGNDDDIIDGGAGIDELNGGGGDDQLYGGGGDDRIIGSVGVDGLYGDGGNDILIAGEGADILFGGTGSDQLIGNNGNDLIFGERGDDILNGGDGEDVIVGGIGTDILRGGSGADSFRFDGLSDSTSGPTRDRIFDFKKDEDVIDLRAVSNDVIDYLESGSFTAAGSAELMVTSNALGTAIVRLDENGDGTSDFEIFFDNLIATFSADDFLL